ncbi:MAG TPA: hypothetical protein VIV66_01095 [Pyrinomonadaceae bacterium]
MRVIAMDIRICATNLKFRACDFSSVRNYSELTGYLCVAEPFRVVITVERQELEDKMTLRHQRGHLRRTTRKNGPAVWEFLWRENDPTGKRLRRTAVIAL